MKEVIIRYHGHACFTLEHQGFRIVLDPYADGMIPGLSGLHLEGEAVFCSHSHGDHAYTQAVALKPSNQEFPFPVEILESFHDDQQGALRGENRIHLFRFDGITVAHLGDLGHIPGEEVLKKLEGVDCLLIPVGGFYTIDPDTAARLVELTQPKVTVPMHYRTDSTGFDVLAHIDTFTAKFDQVNSCVNSFTLTGEEPQQILVIDYKP